MAHKSLFVCVLTLVLWPSQLAKATILRDRAKQTFITFLPILSRASALSFSDVAWRNGRWPSDSKAVTTGRFGRVGVAARSHSPEPAVGFASHAGEPAAVFLELSSPNAGVCVAEHGLALLCQHDIWGRNLDGAIGAQGPGLDKESKDPTRVIVIALGSAQIALPWLAPWGRARVHFSLTCSGLLPQRANCPAKSKLFQQAFVSSCGHAVPHLQIESLSRLIPCGLAYLRLQYRVLSKYWWLGWNTRSCFATSGA